MQTHIYVAPAAAAVHGDARSCSRVDLDVVGILFWAAGVQALADWVPGYVELGPLYKLYMVALTVFATNAINILAGVNGLEVAAPAVSSCNPLWLMTELRPLMLTLKKQLACQQQTPETVLSRMRHTCQVISKFCRLPNKLTGWA